MKVTVTLAFAAALAMAPLAVAAEKAADDAATKEVTGEIVDMMCYVDHNATGDKHASCGEKCIKNGGPVGILSEGKAYLVVGAHKPMNDELAPLAGKTVTLKGKMVSNGGVSMLENSEIVKK
jgi:predicted lipoprotein with Yx(FWY)xxD motif